MKRSNETFLGRFFLKFFAGNEDFARDALRVKGDAVNTSFGTMVTHGLASVAGLYGKPVPPRELFVPLPDPDIDEVDDEEYPPSTNKNVGPTYGHIMEVQTRGRNLYKNFNAKAVNLMPQIFIVGGQDKFACPVTSIALARQAGIEMLVVRTGGHDPIKNRSRRRTFLMEKAETCLEASIRLRDEASVFQGVQKPEQKSQADIEHAPTLGNGAGAALQLGTRFLNAGAGFAKRLLAGSVGNAEMRGQAEGHALNSRHAL
jgi:hypothetical protein